MACDPTVKIFLDNMVAKITKDLELDVMKRIQDKVKQKIMLLINEEVISRDDAEEYLGVKISKSPIKQVNQQCIDPCGKSTTRASSC